jgi:hypothetical protein
VRFFGAAWPDWILLRESMLQTANPRKSEKWPAKASLFWAGRPVFLQNGPVYSTLFLQVIAIVAVKQSKKRRQRKRQL